MKPLYLVCVLAILFITSCSDWRYSNGTKWKQSEYRSSDQAAAKVASPEKVKAEVLSTVAEEKTEEVSAVQEAEKRSTPAVKEEKTEILENAAFKSSEIKKLEGDDDSTIIDEEIVYQAKKAEKNGKKSMIFGIIGLATVFFPPFLLGLVFSIIALAKGIKSLNQRYNTPKGLKFARVGVILSSIALALSVLVIFTVVIVILFL